MSVMVPILLADEHVHKYDRNRKIILEVRSLLLQAAKDMAASISFLIRSWCIHLVICVLIHFHGWLPPVQGLKEIGWHKVAPADGAFYIYVALDDEIEDSEEFCRALLEEAKVAITPGTDFEDPASGKDKIDRSTSMTF